MARPLALMAGAAGGGDGAGMTTRPAPSSQGDVHLLSGCPCAFVIWVVVAICAFAKAMIASSLALSVVVTTVVTWMYVVCTDELNRPVAWQPPTASWRAFNRRRIWSERSNRKIAVRLSAMWRPSTDASRRPGDDSAVPVAVLSVSVALAVAFCGSGVTGGSPGGKGIDGGGSPGCGEGGGDEGGRGGGKGGEGITA